ncbi:hypothetical protein IAT40_000163 [Kwoniella sp. CBS 6097]
MQGMDDMSSTSSGGMSMKMYFHGSIGSDSLWFASWVPTSAGATVGVCIALFLLAIFERYLVAFRRACDVSWRKGVVGYSRPIASGTIPPPQSSSSSGNTSALPHPSGSQDQGSVYRRASSQSQSQSQKDGYDVGSDPNFVGSSTSAGAAAPSYSYQDIDRNGLEQEKQSSPPLAPLAQEPRLSYMNDDWRENGLDHLPKAAKKNLDPARYDRWSRPFRWGVDLPRGLLQALQTLIHYLLMLVVMTFNIWWILAVVVGSGIGEMLFGRFGASHSGH